MRIEEFDYELPPERIAQTPAAQRDASRLLALGPGDRLAHHLFTDLPGLLRPGDLLVLNDARVIPARVMARRASGGRVELLFSRPAPQHGCWWALVRPARRIRPQECLRTPGGVELLVVDTADRGERLVQFPDGCEPLHVLEEEGSMPLPPYIHRDAEHDPRAELDRDRYQTVYAAVPGAVAAPTAGLHFTPELLQRLAEAGIEITFLTLHVGPGTFRPVTVSAVTQHRMDPEPYTIPAACAQAVAAARRQGRRVVAVGTTAVRSLEHAASADGTVRAGAGSAETFIYPGYRFRVVEAMVTNFHLPRSTPILLVAALVGRERLLDAYQEAIRCRYRFYSYGDAMLVQP